MSDILYEDSYAKEKIYECLINGNYEHLSALQAATRNTLGGEKVTIYLPAIDEQPDISGRPARSAEEEEMYIRMCDKVIGKAAGNA